MYGIAGGWLVAPGVPGSLPIGAQLTPIAAGVLASVLLAAALLGILWTVDWRGSPFRSRFHSQGRSGFAIDPRPAPRPRRSVLCRAR